MKLLNRDKKVLVFNLINGALKLIPTVVKEVSEDEYKELNENKFFNFYKDEGKIKIVDEDTKSDKKEDTKVVLNDEIFNSLSDEDLVRSYKVTELKKYLKSKGLENLNGKKEVELIQMGRELQGCTPTAESNYFWMIPLC
jgi:hypothetical protein